MCETVMDFLRDYLFKKILFRSEKFVKMRDEWTEEENTAVAEVK